MWHQAVHEDQQQLKGQGKGRVAQAIIVLNLTGFVFLLKVHERFENTPREHIGNSV